MLEYDLRHFRLAAKTPQTKNKILKQNRKAGAALDMDHQNWAWQWLGFHTFMEHISRSVKPSE